VISTKILLLPVSEVHIVYTAHCPQALNVSSYLLYKTMSKL